MDRIAFDFGIIQIYWYSVLIFLGIFFASVIIIRETKKQNINQDFVINLLFYGIIGGLIGARLYYVLFNLDYYLTYPLEIFEVWNGGLAIHGGLIAGIITVTIYSKKYKVNTMKLLDIIAIGLILGQAIGRWGNFLNQEAYGGITTLENLKNLHLPQFIIDGMCIDGAYRTPTFLYESIWNLLGFFVLIGAKHYKYLKTGWLTGLYLIWYSIGRFIIEGMRADSLMLGSLKIAQIVSIFCIIAGILTIILCRKGTRFDNLYKTKETKETVF